MQCLYISKLIGDGVTPETAFRPAWLDILPDHSLVTGQTIESSRYFFWLGQIDTDATQHAAFLADARIRFIPQSLLSSKISTLTANQKTAIAEVYTWLGFPVNIWDFNNARVADILFYIMGRAAWHPIRQAADA